MFSIQQDYFAASPIHWWKGRSGRWYPHSVVPLYDAWMYEEANYIIARRRLFGELFDPLYIGETSNGSIRFFSHEKMDPAIDLGATHIHVHLLAGSERERLWIETDLRNLHWTPLNNQRAPGLRGIAGLFAE